MRPIGDLVAKVLRQTKVARPELVRAASAAARELWPGIQTQLEVGDFRRGVLKIVLDSHVRLMEARSFLGDAFRHRVNDYLATDGASRRTAGPSGGSGVSELYVSKVVFQVRGTL